SDYLDIGIMASVGAKSYANTEKKGKPVIVEKLGVDITGLRALVVDEVVDSGETLAVLKEYFSSFKPKELKYATLHYKPWSKHKPDYYAAESKDWIVYPWGVVENNKG
ncbi:MAG TPA: phosphoribosyltransferase family protein, partial [Candidatus Nanoarchaeia archaeon]|nr:phosphoribosyltransferase family protein [Candidatus Nanoarchaeia archaeon]